MALAGLAGAYALVGSRPASTAIVTSDAATAVLVVPADTDGCAGAFSRTAQPQGPAATEVCDRLLGAIGAEAGLVADKSAGQASVPLTELARPYTLVMGRSSVASDLSLRFGVSSV